MANVSPGVYTKIIDLSEYVQNVPSTIGFLPIISEMGRDNELVLTSRSEFYVDYGEPNITYATKTFGQGPYIAGSFLSESDALYVIRCLPEDASYANIFISAEATGELGGDSTANISTSSETGMNTQGELDTNLTDANKLVCFYGVGRGEKYNDFQINISRHANPQLSDPSTIGSYDRVYVLDILRRQSEDGDQGVAQYEIISSYEVSFNPHRLDLSGETMFVEDVVNRFNRFINCKADADKCLAAVDNQADFSEPFINGPINLDEGTSGALFSESGVIDSAEATSILSKAYNGTLQKPVATDNSGTPQYVDEVLDTDAYYFTIVLDGGYPTDVKTAGIAELISLRKDCIALIDNGDNISPEDALLTRNNDHTFNTKYMALYESYSKIYDSFTGRDIWLSPIYHMANIVPYTDNVAEIWDAAAGMNRATISNIKELRFSPSLANRDLFYLNQINPIVKFNVGYVVWGQLTTQRRPTALQDLNIIRLVLYIKRALEQFCKFYIFERNNSDTWSAIQREIDRFLKVIQDKRGLYNYSVSVGANEYELKAKQIHANVTLNPTRVVEIINLNFFIV